MTLKLASSDFSFLPSLSPSLPPHQTRAGRPKKPGRGREGTRPQKAMGGSRHPQRRGSTPASARAGRRGGSSDGLEGGAGAITSTELAC